MNCPLCNVTLHISVRSGIEIDYCPKCRGVWLDRGELDKLIERASGIEPWQDAPAAAPPPPRAPQPPRDDYRDRRDARRRDYDDDDDYRRRKRKSFWTEIFDFD